jgi:Cu-processing system permease protein
MNGVASAIESPPARCCAVAAPSHRIVLAFARRELREALSSRWFLLYTLAFGVLAVAVSFMSLAGAGSHGFAGFGRTAAGLLNLIMLVVPLMALTAGAGSIAGERERGSLLYVLVQPVSRVEVLLGKYIGLSTALGASLLLGFGLSAGVLAWRAGGAGAGAFAALGVMACVLAIVMLGVGLLISALSRKASVATGVSLFVWLVLVLLSDLGLMAGAIVFKLRVQELFLLAIVNPLQAFKMGAILGMNASLDVLGPAGAYASRSFGEGLGWLLIGVVLAWAIASIAGAMVAFVRRSPV